MKDRRLSVAAAVDFAYSTKKEADFTSIVVLGLDSDNNYYILDIKRFKTDKINVYFEHILEAQKKWGFKKMRAETTAAQVIIVRDLKDHYIRPYGIPLVIEEYRPTKNKEERIEAALQSRYNNKQIWHFKGGNCSVLEEELVNQRPPHDDIKDSLASCIEICVPPIQTSRRIKHGQKQINTNSRFGGLG
jgi:phage terminase large subunit-like protein